MKALADFLLWRRAVDLVAECYRVSATFPHVELFSMTSQLRRAALSVASNVAEGSGRATRKDYLRFLSMARGSLREVETILAVAKILDYATTERVSRALALTDEVSRLMAGLRRSLLAREGLAGGPADRL